MLGSLLVVEVNVASEKFVDPAATVISAMVSVRRMALRIVVMIAQSLPLGALRRARGTRR